MYSSHYLFLLIAAYFLFLRRSHYDYDAELIFSHEERFDFVTPSNRVSCTIGAIAKAVPTCFPVHLRARCASIVLGSYFGLFLMIKFSDADS
jgi:hypothetical protein